MTLDFKLRYLRQTQAPVERVHVLLRFKNDVTALSSLGCKVTSVAGDVAAVSVPVESLEGLKEHPEVVYVEAPHALKDEIDLSAAAINLINPATGLRTIPSEGDGAIIGVIDSGFDLTHPCFSDAQKKSRILAAWDQSRSNIIGTPPEGFDYGVEYTREVINEHLSAGKVLIVRNHNGAGAHGTYVAGIAAGNGTPHGIYRGVAPQANLILVTYRNDVPVGGSAFVLDAISYISECARSYGRPVVINISQGDNLGAHDGTSLLERAIDNVVEQGRVLVVTSAGNERKGQVGHHARGKVRRGEDFSLPFSLRTDANRAVDGDTIELWYRRGDRFAVALKPPGGALSDFISPGGSGVINFPNGNQAHVYSEVGHPTNGDNHVGIILEKGEGWKTGTWELILRGEEVEDGDFDAWADRPNGVTLVGFDEHKSDASTVTLPGNARRAVTVGWFISRREQERKTDEVVGDLASASSIGPTRDGRIKPDLTAPGSLIMAPRIRIDSPLLSYDPQAGTSMAAPHVSGTIALMWALWPELPGEQIRAALLSTAREDAFTGATPNVNWGAGKLDAEGVYKALSILVEKRKTDVGNRSAFEFEMNPKPKPTGEPAGMAVRIEVDNGDTISISGTSDGEHYVGTLILRRKKAEADGGDAEKHEGAKKKDGGDECWINGVWYSPCPPGGG